MVFDETAWVAIAFVIFIFLVWKKSSSALISILDDKSNKIKNEIDEARLLKEESMEELRKSLQIQKNSTEEFERIISEAKEIAKKIKEDAETKSLETINRRETQAKLKITSLENDAIKTIKIWLLFRVRNVLT
jgi:F-type H+-transporting ATPase subunit b